MLQEVAGKQNEPLLRRCLRVRELEPGGAPGTSAVLFPLSWPRETAVGALDGAAAEPMSDEIADEVRFCSSALEPGSDLEGRRTAPGSCGLAGPGRHCWYQLAFNRLPAPDSAFPDAAKPVQPCAEVCAVGQRECPQGLALLGSSGCNSFSFLGAFPSEGSTFLEPLGLLLSVGSGFVAYVGRR